MPTWRCVLTSRRDDGSFTWRRTDAAEPRGSLPLEMVPEGAEINGRVILEVSFDMGKAVVSSCRLDQESATHPVVPVAEPSQSPNPLDSGIFRPGDVRWANVLNPLENVNSTGKWRPVLLVSSTQNHWNVMGFTTKSRYESGGPRVPIPDWSAVGLDRPGYIWGNRLIRITADSVGELIGRADQQLADTVINLAGARMKKSEITYLRSATRKKAVTSPVVAGPRTTSTVVIPLTGPGLRDFITRHRDQVEADLEEYFCGDTYTGRKFESFSAESSSEYFDGSNVAAVMSLSVALKARIPSDLHNIRHETSDHLRHVDRSVPIWNQPVEVIGPDGHLQALYDLLRAIPDVGPAIASKLLASKLPHLVPVWDRDVWRLTGEPEQWWLGWHSAMSDSRLREQLRTLRDVTGREDISLLRIADVALWMEAQRRKQNFTL